MKKTDQEIVLQAVMSNMTPLGAILNRLATKTHVPESSLNKERILSIINDLCQKKLVIVKVQGNEQLFRKVPHALKLLSD
jgi:hypothetical protein